MLVVHLSSGSFGTATPPIRRKQQPKPSGPIPPDMSASGSVEFCETLGNNTHTDQTRILALAQERRNGGGEGRAECLRLNRGDVGVRESSKGLGGQVVVAAGLDSG